MGRNPAPNYDRFDFEGFVERAISRDAGFNDLTQVFQNECGSVEHMMRGRGGPQARADGGHTYVARLKRVLFWFHHGVLADQGQERDTCHRLAEKLVARGDLKTEALIVFRPRNSESSS